MKIKCGITGHTGVLGKSIIKKLPFKFIKFKGDVTKRKQLNIWFKKNKLDIVMHLAAIVPTDVVKKNIKRAYKVNYDGTKNIVDEITKNSQIKWFFFHPHLMFMIFQIRKFLKILKFHLRQFTVQQKLKQKNI